MNHWGYYCPALKAEVHDLGKVSFEDQLQIYSRSKLLIKNIVKINLAYMGPLTFHSLYLCNTEIFMLKSLHSKKHQITKTYCLKNVIIEKMFFYDIPVSMISAAIKSIVMSLLPDLLAV